MDTKEALEFLDDLGMLLFHDDTRELTCKHREAMSALRKRLEWQPMETCPMGNVLFRDETRVYKGYRHRLWETHVIYDNHEIDLREKFTGWMPLPEVE